MCLYVQYQSSNRRGTSWRIVGIIEASIYHQYDGYPNLISPMNISDRKE